MADGPQTKPQLPPLVDAANAADIYADEAAGFFLMSGNVRITFASLRGNHSTDPASAARVVVGRLVLPLGAAEALQKGLAEFLERMKAQANTVSGNRPKVQ